MLDLKAFINNFSYTVIFITKPSAISKKQFCSILFEQFSKVHLQLVAPRSLENALFKMQKFMCTYNSCAAIIDFCISNEDICKKIFKNFWNILILILY